MELFEILRLVERSKGLLVILADYETGIHGHDSPVYHGLATALSLANETICKIKNGDRGDS